MSYKTKVRLNKIADLLEKDVREGVRAIALAAELVLIDFTHGKAKYRRGRSYERQPRTTYRERVIIRPAAPRLVMVDQQKRVKAIR